MAENHLVRALGGWLIWSLGVCFVWGLSYWGYSIHWTLGLPIRLFALLLTAVQAVGLYSILREYFVLRNILQGAQEKQEEGSEEHTFRY